MYILCHKRITSIILLHVHCMYIHVGSQPCCKNLITFLDLPPSLALSLSLSLSFSTFMIIIVLSMIMPWDLANWSQLTKYLCLPECNYTLYPIHTCVWPLTATWPAHVTTDHMHVHVQIACTWHMYMYIIPVPVQWVFHNISHAWCPTCILRCTCTCTCAYMCTYIYLHVAKCSIVKI